MKLVIALWFALTLFVSASLLGAQLRPGTIVALDTNGIVWHIDDAGRATTFATLPGIRPHGIDFDKRGAMILGGVGAVYRLDPSGTLRTVFSGAPLAGMVGDIAVSRSGNYYVPIANGGVLELTPAGVIKQTIATGSGRLWGLGLDEQGGNLYLSGQDVRIVNLQNNTVTTLFAGAPLQFPQGGTAGPTGTFVFGDEDAKTVFEIDAQGNLTTLIRDLAFRDIGEGVALTSDHRYILTDDQGPGTFGPLVYELDSSNALATIARLPSGTDLSDCAVVPEAAIVPLAGNPAPGGVGAFEIRTAGSPCANYVLASSLSATTGFPLPGGRQFPLDADALFTLTAQNLAPSMFVNYRGGLDAGGRAVALINVPDDNRLRGMTIYTAVVILDPNAVAGIQLVSAALPITIQS